MMEMPQNRREDRLRRPRAIRLLQENLHVGVYQERSEAVTCERITEISAVFARLAERRTQLRRHHCPGRAGDGVDRPRADARAEAPGDRRALARPVVAPS
jgi:hypothetical protein